MLLEAALADFSSDEAAAALLENQVLQQQQEDRSLVQIETSIPFSWDILQGKPPTTTQSEYSGDVDVATAPSSSSDTSVIDQYSRHHHSSSSSRHNQRVRYSSGELVSPHHIQQQDRHYSGELRLKTVQTHYSGEQSQVSGNAAAEGGSTPFASRISAIHRERTSIGTSDASEPGFYRGRGLSTSSSRYRSHSTDPVGRREEQQDVGCSSVEGDVEDDMCEGEYEVVCTIPLEREAHHPNSDPSSSTGNRSHQVPLAAPASRLLIIRESDQGESSNFSSPRNGPFSPAGRSRRSGGSQQSQRVQQQQQQVPARLKVYPGDVIRISRMSSFQSSTNSPHCSVDIEMEKFFQEDSPVSTLEQLPSPPDSAHHRNHLPPHRNPRRRHRRNESSSSGHVPSLAGGSSSSPSSRRGSAARPNSSASASPIAETEHRVWTEPPGVLSPHEEEAPTRGRALRCLPSFNSASLHSSAPPVSNNSSSSNFLATCLVALELALRSEVEEEDEYRIREEHEEEDDDSDDYEPSVEEEGSGGISSRYHHEEEEEEEGGEEEEGFLSMEDSEEGENVDLRDATISRRSSSDGTDLRRRRTLSHRWVSNVQFEPEYHTMDFFSESEVASPSNSAYRITSEATSSLQESEMCRFRDLRYQHRQRRRLPQDVRSNLDQYSWGDERFLQAVEHDRMNSWADDDLSVEFNNISTQHDDVFWDDQQSEMNLERAEEVIRGAVDGLRFTYSPVSSAFVFTRPENSGTSYYEVNRQPQSTDDQMEEYSPPHTVDTEGSQRFSISLDYASSVCSEDSLPYSMGRSSFVTELGLSRAESWSRVQRGAVSSENAAQRYPSGLLDHRKEAGGEGRGGGGGGYAVVQEDSSGEIYESPENDLMNEDQSPSQLAPKRATKKYKLPTCLAFRSILKTLKAFSPRRSRLSPPSPPCPRSTEESWSFWLIVLYISKDLKPLQILERRFSSGCTNVKPQIHHARISTSCVNTG
ncbi:hypothetical protein R1sor_026133 [Riccia sorocarpa]|uniref:Uncharacterized protein n=1 Tax=Riccia sorocarpa TaxID=122646 RepID=A0ABD3GAL2_9MARC